MFSVWTSVKGEKSSLKYKVLKNLSSHQKPHLEILSRLDISIGLNVVNVLISVIVKKVRCIKIYSQLVLNARF